MKLGIHKGIKIIGCYIGESQEKKTPFFGLELQNKDGDTIEKDFYLTPATQEKNLQMLLDAGYKGKSLSDMADSKLSIDDLFGEPKDEISVTISEESYNDKEGNPRSRNIVQWFNVGFAGKSKADHAQAKMIFKNTSFDGLFSKMKKGEPGPKKEMKQKADEVAQHANEDDIPF